MKIKLLMIIALLLANLSICAAQTKDVLHAPKKGSAERRAILDALRRGGATGAKFLVAYLKVHNGWAWIDATPLDARGRATAEGGASLLHLEGNIWKIADLSIVAEDPNNPMGAQDLSKVYLANLRKTFPGAPLDIFPKAAF